MIILYLHLPSRDWMVFSGDLDFFASILSEVEVESGSRDKEVARRFWFMRGHKAAARFQPELSFRILEEIHWSKETPSSPGGEYNWD